MRGSSAATIGWLGSNAGCCCVAIVSSLSVTCCLQLEHFGVAALVLQKLTVRALLCDTSAFQNQNPVGHLHRREAMRNQQRHFPLGEFGKPLKHFVFRSRVQRRGWFV